MARMLAVRYTLERVIGEGGMATVWRARDSRLDRAVAVKVMSEQIARDPEFRARFIQEARAAASFSHPNVVDVLDYGEENDVPYIVMELVDGEDLRALLERENKLAPEETARIGAGVARGLAAAHRRGLIHRDIKPANILLDGDRTPKLTDFGIVRALGTATQTKAGMTFGSVHYLSPEQVQGAPVDARSDLYSLGVVLYEAATGERPFDGDAPAAIAVRRLSEAPRPPHAVEPTLPQWLSTVIERAMAREPERRYRTAMELERDLESHRASKISPVATDATVGIPVVAGPRAIERAGVAAPVTPRRSLFPFLVTLLIALAFVGLGAFFLIGVGRVPVPDVRDKFRDDAIAELQAAGFQVRILGPFENPAPRGNVYRQEPQPPARLRFGEPVTIFLSGGPEPVPVPRLQNLTLDNARRRLEDAGLRLGDVLQRSDEFVQTGLVIDQNPKPNERVSPGTTVDLVQSSGPRPTPTPSPTPTPTQAPPPTDMITPPPTPVPTPRR